MLKNQVLVLNCGSSTIKFAVIHPQSGETAINGLVDCIGLPESIMAWRQTGQEKQQKKFNTIDYMASVKEIIQLLSSVNLLDQVMAVGHRIVQGASYFYESMIITQEVISKIDRCCCLAPLHNPAHVIGVKAMMKVFPELPQVAVFDNAFHQTMPERAYLYAIPYELYEKHQIRRYGFHGTSYRYVSAQAARRLNKPLTSLALIAAHLGNGCSVAAILDGKSMDTSMGLTPLEGLVMGTRSGNVDPGLPEFLLDELHYHNDIQEVTKILNKKSGLLGISGISSDMRAIEQAAAGGHKRAQLAEELFTYRLAKYIMSYLVPLNGRFDALIFTAGIGENSSIIRAKVLGYLKALHFEIDEERNAVHGRDTQGIITTEGTPIAMVVPTNEEWMIAQDTEALTRGL